MSNANERGQVVLHCQLTPPRIPFLDLYPPLRASGSIPGTARTSPGYSSSALALHWMRDRDFQCLVLKLRSVSLQAAHVVNASRKSKHHARNVENALRKAGAIPLPIAKNFDLQHASNIMPLSGLVHSSLDLYGIIALAPSLTSLNFLKTLLTLKNEEYQRAVDVTGSNATKPPLFDNSDELLNPELELVVLHPTYFAFGDGIPYFEESAGGHLIFDRDTQSVLIKTDDGQTFPYRPFRPHSKRLKFEQLNVFFFVINAHGKFSAHQKSYGSDGFSQRTRAIIEATKEVYEQLFFRPKPTPGSRGESEDQAAAEIWEVQKRLKQERIDAAPTRSSDRQRARTIVASDRHGEITEEGIHLEEYDQSSSDDDDLSEPGDLSNDEVEKLQAIIDDPTSKQEDRLAAITMLLHGPEPLPLPVLPGVSVPPSATGLDHIKQIYG
ncbi:hypothetical protein MIND_01071200 [Mycena indigotica]|uniref:Uncharacterized protein n=1 Tax=Mycena indigotica TaxID=2126181 RepID=A0A8H6VVC5_9AGAR|nr:uncharacterized protein MIND_01071200 [Mycena indigotica]KAF7295319.1 hypothetical protein MIND_01071200 [Mycena indigotica]